MNTIRTALLAAICLAGASLAAQATDVLTVKTIGMDVANEIAVKAVHACRKQGFQVSVVVVDRSGIVQVALRDDLAAFPTMEIAESKARFTIMAGVKSGVARKNLERIRTELNHVTGVLVMEGGVLINAGGSRIGAIGVSGAPGGHLDEACATQAIASVEERLEFAD